MSTFLLKLPNILASSEFQSCALRCSKVLCWPILFPSLPKSPKYLVSRYLDPLKAFSGDICGFKHRSSSSAWLEDSGFYMFLFPPKKSPTQVIICSKFVKSSWGAFAGRKKAKCLCSEQRSSPAEPTSELFEVQKGLSFRVQRNSKWSPSQR